MKQAFLFGVLSLLVASSAYAQLPPTGYIGLYADSNHSVNEVWNPGGYHQFTMYVFCLPSDRGLKCLEFAVSYPENLFKGTVTGNPGLSVSQGDLESGMSACFIDCQYDWIWSHSQAIILMDTIPSVITIERHTQTGMYQFSNCLENYPTEPVYFAPPLCLNTSCPPDEYPPQLVEAVAVESRYVEVAFDERLFQPSTEEEGNYEVFEEDDSLATIPITFAQLLDGDSTVGLTLGFSVTEGIIYSLRVSNVQDAAGNTINPGSMINFTGIDTDPPSLVDATALNRNEVVVTFSEPVALETAEDIFNYEVHNGTGFHPTDVQLLLEGTKVKLIFDAPYLSYGVSYALSVSNVTDLAGNVIPPGSSILFILHDTDQPTLVSAAAVNDTTVHVTFDEPIDPTTAEDITNYWLHETANPSDSIPIVSADLLGDVRVVELHVGIPLTVGVLYTLTVSNVEDRWGNPIASGSEITVVLLADTIPPELLAGTALNDILIELTFSEAMDSSSAQNVNNYLIFESDDPSAVVPVAAADLQEDGTHVRLSLGVPLAVEVSYKVLVHTVTDLAGNPIDPYGIVTVIIHDTESPELAGVSVIDVMHVEVVFSEPMDASSASEEGNYRLYETANPVDSIPVAIATLLTDFVTVRLTLVIPLDFEVSYTLAVNNVEDAAGNPIVPGSEASFIVHDVYPPVLLAVTKISSTLLDVQFSETLDSTTAVMIENYEIFEMDSPSVTIPLTNAEITGDGSTVRLTLGDALSVETNYVLRVSNVQDLVGNPIEPGSEFIIYEEYPPGLIGASPLDPTHVEVTFSEPMDSVTAEVGTNYELYETANPSNVISIILATLLPDKTTVRLSLSTGLAFEISYTIRVSDVTDIAGNPIPSGSTASFVVYDVFPPTLVTADVVNDTLVEVTFSEPVNAVTAEDASNYLLFVSGDTSSVVTVIGADLYTDNVTVGLSLGEALGYVNYTLRVRDVEDLVGNLIVQGSEIPIIRFDLPPVGYIGLYIDEGHSLNEVEYTGDLTLFDLYVWCLPSERGMKCAEFAVNYPTGVFGGPVTESSFISGSLGDLASGMSVCFIDCQYYWIWTHKQTCMLMTEDSEVMQIIPHPGVYPEPAIQFANCLEGFPKEPAFRMSDVLVNPGQAVSTLLHSFSTQYRESCIEVTWTLVELDRDIVFLVSRADKGTNFRELNSIDIERNDRTFTFCDREIEYGKMYHYRVEYTDGNERYHLFETGLIETPSLPLALYQNRPNPFNPATSIIYSIPEAGHVVLDIYDVSGRKVARLVDEYQEHGEHTVKWRGVDDFGKPVSSGVYFSRLIFGKESFSRKMILLR